MTSRRGWAARPLDAGLNAWVRCASHHHVRVSSQTQAPGLTTGRLFCVQAGSLTRVKQIAW